MTRKKIIGLLIFIAFIISGLFIWQRFSKPSLRNINSSNINDSLKNHAGVNDSMNSTAYTIHKPEQKDSIPENWKTYSNDKLGISFQYPNSWTKQGKDAEVINLSGTVIKRGIYYTDSMSQTRVSIEYTIDSNAAKIYQYAVSEYITAQKSTINKNKKFLIDRNEAIEISKELSVNGKGRTLNPPLRIITVDFMDKNNKGEVQIQFQTPLSQESEEENIFKQFLSSFKFIKN